MSTDYKFTIKRKADDKTLASFYYNRIKNLYDIDATGLKLDPENIRSSGNRYTTEDIENDIQRLKSKEREIWKQIFEKKLLMPLASNIDIKDDFAADIHMLEDEVKDVIYAIEALSGLLAVVTVLVEDIDRAPDVEDDDSRNIGYIFNAEGLQPNAGMTVPHIWNDGVYIEAKALC